MKVTDSKCPNCGSIVKIESGKATQFCQYCGNQIVIEDEMSHTTRIIDEAKIKEIETKKEVELKKQEQRKLALEEYKSTNKTLLTVWGITLAICLILGFVDNGFWGVFLIDLVIGAIVAISRTNKKP